MELAGVVFAIAALGLGLIAVTEILRHGFQMGALVVLAVIASLLHQAHGLLSRHTGVILGAFGTALTFSLGAATILILLMWRAASADLVAFVDQIPGGSITLFVVAIAFAVAATTLLVQYRARHNRKLIATSAARRKPE